MEPRHAHTWIWFWSHQFHCINFYPCSSHWAIYHDLKSVHWQICILKSPITSTFEVKQSFSFSYLVGLSKSVILYDVWDFFNSYIESFHNYHLGLISFKTLLSFVMIEQQFPVHASYWLLYAIMMTFTDLRQQPYV